jgi:DNA/RNA-binding domain of Phe-tRNA-synthetase-like protein
MPLIEIDELLRGKIALGGFQAAGITAAGASPRLEEDLEALLAGIRARYREPADAVEIFQPARALYRALGLDPTKVRPSSEALIRRVIRGQGLYRINRVVDTCNFCSIDIALSIGLYDSAQVRWPVTLRKGLEGEGYAGLGKDHVNVSGRYTLADSDGPFGNPSSDSFRTRIRETTTACTFVIFAPASYDLGRLRAQTESCGRRMTEYNGGKVDALEILR